MLICPLFESFKHIHSSFPFQEGTFLCKQNISRLLARFELRSREKIALILSKIKSLTYKKSFVFLTTYSEPIESKLFSYW